VVAALWSTWSGSSVHGVVVELTSVSNERDGGGGAVEHVEW